ncbi:hypothetical protein [Streptomyces sp. NPDC057910]|uniref:hypothetical protein n=1 Tax=Streptomyces sp. NPDC057910 TaxID=3346278 RepID=UPI0036EC735D
MTVRPGLGVGAAGRTPEAVQVRSDEPIYATLAARWSAAGRVVPGQADREWTMLASRCPWPTR